MTPNEFKAARQAMGLSTYQLADLLRIGTTTETGAKSVREMERGARGITGPITVVMEALGDGWRPHK